MTAPQPLNRLLASCSSSTRGGLILRRLIAYHPKPVTRHELMEGAGIMPRIEGRLSAAASFAWHILRINDDLAGHGWATRETGFASEMYALVELESGSREAA